MKKNLNLSDRAKNGRNGVQLVYVLDCIKNSASATDQDMNFENDNQVLQFFFDEFKEEFNYEYNKRYYPNLQQRIEYYLRGLPGCCNIEFIDYNILQLGVKWGVLSCADDKKACSFVANFWSVCALRIIQAATKVGININMYL